MIVEADERIVKSWLEEQTRYPQDFKTNISEADEMFLYALQNLGDRDRATIRYYFIGKRILDAVKQVLNWHFEKTQISSFLDFACGYGRFTRYLIQELPPEKVWVADIYAEAVNFQREYLGVNGIVSTVEPEDFSLENKFDCILACSFFSHIPERRFASWMQKLYDLLTNVGVLMFSVHDEALLPSNVEIGSGGILFSPASESRFLDKEEYGTTFVNEAFVRKVVASVSEGQAFICRIKEGICGAQDLYLVSKKPFKDLDSFNFRYHPKAGLEYCQAIADDRIRLKGWAIDLNPQGKIDDILIVVNGQIVEKCQPSYSRPDLAERFPNSELLNCGWSCDFATDKVSLDDVISIKAVNNYGLEWIMEVNTLKQLTTNN
ncbi:MAG: class I SAM-dependent methyltransferase [Cyanobacteriota bacterium]|nr:class I SAM-dependent methyltransferase [Cyanobacteriota bacterium]